ncbi:probable serine/threonine-protein kinase drkA isoform X2 [Rhopilema esculentum]|uniref:probable serine/threonine-protein kinase drkA isoform X2 n=1 Tax=Rhopilema esculentum TaxID=499914 RepID=UPI0031DF29E0
MAGIFWILQIFLVIGNHVAHMHLAKIKNKPKSEVITGKMLSSCVCDINGDIYNLTSAGNPSGPTPLSFPETKEAYFYLISICYPFEWPQVLKNNPTLISRFVWWLKRPPYQPRCQGASLCQRSDSDPDDYFKLVTSQKDSINCFLNRTTGHVNWVYKGVGPLFSKGGLVLNLNCGSSHKIRGIRDIDRTKGNPWKYVNITDKCCCKNRCKEAESSTLQPSKDVTRKSAELYAELGIGFLVLFVLLVLGVRFVVKRLAAQTIIPQDPPENYGTFVTDPVLRQKLIPYSEIQNIMKVDEGSFGVVSRGTWRGSEVAIKRIKDHIIEEDKNHFLEESKWMSRLTNRHIVQFYGICHMEPNLCIISEFMSGGSVADVIHKRKEVLTWERIIEWVCDFGTLKLIKPLIERKRENDKAETWPSPSGQTQANKSFDTHWIGTLRWCAPEVIPKPGSNKKIKFTTKSDAYSFAITVWEMIYNKRPYHMLNWDHQVISAITSGNTPSTDENCPDALERLLGACWKMQPKDRPDFTQILERLSSIEAPSNR